jgi:hypothetical protein
VRKRKEKGKEREGYSRDIVRTLGNVEGKVE